MEFPISEHNVHYKKHLKDLIKEKVSNAKFIPSKRKYESDLVCSKENKQTAMAIVLDDCNESEGYSKMLNVAKSIRKELDDQKRWKFEGELDNFEYPIKLKKLIEWIVLGPTSKASTNKDPGMSKCINILVQMIVQNFKTDRQANYGSLNPYSQIETPLSIGTGLFVHKNTRSAKMLDFLYDINLSISSDKMYCINQDIANAIRKKAEACDGLYIPSSIDAKDMMHFAVDNTDLQIDTPNGKRQLHGTAMVVFQKQNNQKTEVLKFERLTKNQSSRNNIPFYEVMYCAEPERQNRVWEDAVPAFQFEDEMKKAAQNDLAHVMMKSVENLALQVPTWAAYNSLLGIAPHTSTHIRTLPLINGSPTDWSNLYTALRIVQGINTSQATGRKTIVSMDMQLYAYCIQLQSKEEIRDNFAFRTGELHVVFAMIKAIGKYIDSSGIDQAFIEAELFRGPCLKVMAVFS